VADGLIVFLLVGFSLRRGGWREQGLFSEVGSEIGDLFGEPW